MQSPCLPPGIDRSTYPSFSSLSTEQSQLGVPSSVLGAPNPPSKRIFRQGVPRVQRLFDPHHSLILEGPQSSRVAAGTTCFRSILRGPQLPLPFAPHSR